MQACCPAILKKPIYGAILVDVRVVLPPTGCVSLLCRMKDYSVALQLLLWMLGKYPEDVHLLSTAGFLQLNIGHTDEAAHTFEVSAGLP